MTARRVELDGSWGIGDKLHGGYLLATVVREAMAGADTERHPHPVAASALYVAPPRPGPASVEVRELRAGRSVASYAAVLAQEGQPCVQVLLTAGRLVAGQEPATWAGPAASSPVLPPRQQCVGRRDGDRPASNTPGHLHHVELLLDPPTARWADGAPSGQGESRGWLRLAEGWDPLIAQFVLADAMPPVTFDLGLWGWVPTLQLQVVLRRVVTGDWQVGQQQARLVAGGLLDEDCTLWDSDGQLTCQARQLAAFRHR